MTLAEDVGRVPVLGYHNLLSTGYTVTASSELAGFEKEKCYDGRTYTQWGFATGAARTIGIYTGGASATVNYIAFAYHNLGLVSATIKLQTSTNGSSWTDRITITPFSTRPVFKLFTAVAAPYIRVEISGHSASGYIGVLYFGERLELPSPMPVGFTPASYNRHDKMLINVSDGGHLTGLRQISQANEITFPLRYLEDTWIDSNYGSIVGALIEKPMFVLHDKTNYPDAAFIGWLNGELPTPRFDTNRTYSLDISLRGLGV